MPGRDLVVRYDGDASGADAAANQTRASLQQTAAAAQKMSGQFSASMQKAGASGAKVGDSLVRNIAKATGSQILKGVGSAIGTKIVDGAGLALQRTNIYKSLSAKAGAAGAEAGSKLGAGLNKAAAKAGSSAGDKVKTGVERNVRGVNWSRLKTPALVATALGLGILFGRRFGNSAENSARSAFHPRFSLGGLTSGLKYAALGAGAAVGGALGSAIALGGKRLDSIDAAQGKLRGLGHDAKAVTAIMNDALASVKGTAFGLDEAASVSATAVAAGIKPGKDLQRTLKLIADTATIGNTSLGESGAIFNKVATSNKVYNDTLNQLGDRGIPIVQLLAKQMGVTAGEVTKLASKGKIDFKTFQGALEAGLGGAALKSGDTFQGALKNAKAALGRFGANLLAGAFPQLKGVFGDVTKGLDSLAPTAKRIGVVVGRVFGDLVGLAKALGPVFGSVGRIASSAFGGFADSVGGGRGAIKSLTDFVSTHQAELTEFFVSAGHAAIGFAKGVAGGALVAIGALRGLNAAVTVGISAFSNMGHDVLAILSGLAGPIDAVFGSHIASTLTGVQSNLDALAAHSKTKGAEIDSALGGAGKGITDKLLPALDAADSALTRTGKIEAFKASQRDAAARTAIAIRDVGTASNGSQIRIKRWADVSKLGADAQRELRSNIKRAQSALQGQIGAQQAAGAGQKALTKTWQTGRSALASEFRQMGLSRKEAGRLADKYAGIKPKVKTKFETPGLPGAKSGTDNYRGSLSNVPGRKSTKFSTPGLSTAVSQARNLDGTLRRIPTNIQIKINQSVATKGDRLAANRKEGGVWNGPDTVIRAARGRVLPGWSPGRDIHKFYSATAGELDLSGGEAIMRPEFTRAVGGAAGVDRLNRQAESGQLARGLSTGGVASLAMLPEAPSASPRAARRSTDSMSRSDVDRIVAAMESLEFGVQITADRQGFKDLVRAEVAEALRKKKT